MRPFLFGIVVTALLACDGCVAQSHSADQDTKDLATMFTPVGDYPLGKSTDRLDYQSVDTAARRLYIADMGAGQLLSFDLDNNKLVAALDNFPKVTGVLAVPDQHKIYASVPGAGLVPSLHVALGMAGLSSGRGAVAVVDAANLREIARLPGGVFPDGIAYDSKEHKIFVSDELGSAILVIDAEKDRLVTRIDTGGEVGNVRYDPRTGRIYVPIQSHGTLAVIDPVADRIVTRYALPGADHPHGLIIAPDEAIGYVACDGNNRLLTVDLATGHVLARHAVARDPDVLAIDPAAKRLYVAGESGTLSSFDIAMATAPRALGDVFVGDDAHSVAVDPVSHQLYFPLGDVNGQAVLRVLAPKP